MWEDYNDYNVDDEDDGLTSCALCDRRFPEEKMRQLGEAWICSECFIDNCFECEKCGEYDFNENNWGEGQNLCENCLNGETASTNTR